MPAVFTNAPTGTSAALLDIGVTTLILQAGEGQKFASPGVGDYQVILMRTADWVSKEYLHVTSRSGDTLTVLRGQEGSPQVSWPADTIVEGIITAGILDLFAQAGAAGLTNLTDVTITSPLADQCLVYNGSQWVNAPVPAPASLGSIGDVTITSPQTNQMLRWTGSAWINDGIPINNLSDVSAPAPSLDQVLAWDGVNWTARITPLPTVVLNDLDDVTIGLPQNTELLQYVATEWQNVSLQTVLGTVVLTDLSDVNAPAPAEDDVLMRVGSEWVNQTPAQLAAKQAFADLSDTDLTEQTEHARLEYVNGLWRAIPPGTTSGAMQGFDAGALFTASDGVYDEIDTLDYSAGNTPIANFELGTVPRRLRLNFDTGVFDVDDIFLAEVSFTVTFDVGATSAEFDFTVMRNGTVVNGSVFVRAGTAGSHTAGLPLSVTLPPTMIQCVNRDEFSIAVRGNGADTMTISNVLLICKADYVGPAGTI